MNTPMHEMCTGAQSIAPGARPATIEDFVCRIQEGWQKLTETVLAVAKVCAEANQTLTRADRSELIRRLRLSRTVFAKLAAIGADSRLHEPEIRGLLPPHYSVVYELTKFSSEEMEAALEAKVIHRKAKRAELIAWRDRGTLGRPAPVPEMAEPQTSPIASPPIAHDDADHPDLPVLDRAGGERDAQAFETLKSAWEDASDAVRRRFCKEVLQSDQLSAATGRAGLLARGDNG
jgi:hypothetical protein